MTDLAEYFRSQANWREGRAEEYPDDKRNEQSARALQSLAEFVESDEPNVQVVAALEGDLHPDSHALGGEETARAVSRYGYGYPATDASHGDFLEELVQLCLRDAYEYAREHGEDWTDSLYEFELEAAKEGVPLPPYYFSRRPRWLESEAEEAVREIVEEYRREEEN